MSSKFTVKQSIVCTFWRLLLSPLFHRGSFGCWSSAGKLFSSKELGVAKASAKFIADHAMSFSIRICASSATKYTFIQWVSMKRSATHAEVSKGNIFQFVAAWRICLHFAMNFEGQNASKSPYAYSARYFWQENALTYPSNGKIKKKTIVVW